MCPVFEHSILDTFPLAPNLSFQGGTLVLYDVDQNAEVHDSFQWIKARWRCEAYHYPAVSAWLHRRNIRDSVPRWQRLGLTIHDDRKPHDYQLEALHAWEQAGRLGSIVLPTGAGKTFVAIQAIQQVGRSTVVVAPTIDLLHQWYARLANAFGATLRPDGTSIHESASAPTHRTASQNGHVPEHRSPQGELAIGVYYGGEKLVQPITVTTYHSAGDFIATYGNQFKLIIYDEVHHLPAPSWGETALMTPAPHRLGLTATYPELDEQMDGRWRVDDLIGPIVYEKRIDDLVGAQLAEYRTERIRVDLTAPEREQYEANYAVYAGFFREHRLPQTHGPRWLMELMRMSAFDEDARRALLARQRIQRLLAAAEAKLAMLERLLRENVGERILVFSDNNDVVYRIARRHLIPALTHETKAAERKHILEAFQEGHYQAVVTSKVLNEGVDVPEAKIAIVLGGSANARQYIQRLGRVLRKVGNRQAILYEVIVRGTVDEGRTRRRRLPQPQVEETA